MTAAVIDADSRLSTAPLPGGGQPLAWALIASILLHLLLLFLWVGVERRDLPPVEPEIVAIPMEYVEPPPPAPPAREAQRPPPPPPPAPVPQVAPPPPPPPQLETATPAERSSSPRPEARPETVPPIDRRATPAPSPSPAAREAVAPEPSAAAETPPIPTSPDGLAPPPPAPAPRRAAPPTPPAQRQAQVQDEARPTVGGGMPSEKVTQAETDFLLAQILRNWLLDYSNPRFADGVMTFTFVIEPDGMLQSPINGREKLNYRAVIADYDSLVAAAAYNPAARDARSVLESFITAVHNSQPFARQPGAPPVTQARMLEIRFKLGDLPPRR